MVPLVQRTTIVKTEEAKPDWFVIDGDNQIVGRLATQIATVLMGKHKANYTANVVSGDVVVVVNAHRVRFSGNAGRSPLTPYYTKKFEQRTYERFSGYPSGRKVFTASQMLQRRPQMILQEAVRRMLPKNKLGSQMLKNLRLFCGPTHEHQAQQPKPFPEYLLPK